MLVPMSAATVTLDLPEPIYLRLRGAAQAMRRPLEEVLLRALRLGSPPTWEDVPAEFQADLAALDRMDDDALRAVAGSHREATEMSRYDELLGRAADGSLTDGERFELSRLRSQQDLFILRKAHAAALLKWRGSRLPAL